jgi:hypothetical protein
MMTPSDPKIPRPEDFALIASPIVKCLLEVSKSLKGSKTMWAVGGDLGETMNGVLVKPEWVEILTNEEGAHEISQLMKEHNPTKVRLVQERLPRDAEVGGQKLPVYVRSHYCELTVNNVKVKVRGALQYKVDNWEWGDPLEFQPDAVYVVGEKIAVVPLQIESELFIGLGWMDKVERIATAMAKKMEHHHHEA